jgi:phenylacetate-coenzyme A ligase PaaK-like adenylate-forming protein
MCVMALGAIAGLAQGVMGMMAGNANAKMAEAEAKRIRQLGAIEEQQLRKRHDIELGQQRVDIAAAGRSGSTGTPLQLAFASRQEAEIEALFARDGYTMRSDAKRAEAANYRNQGLQTLVGSAFSAAGTFLNSAAPIPALR